MLLSHKVLTITITVPAPRTNVIGSNKFAINNAKLSNTQLMQCLLLRWESMLNRLCICLMNQPRNVINRPQAVVSLWINWYNFYPMAIASHRKSSFITKQLLDVFFYLASSRCLHCLVAYDNAHIIIVLQNPLCNES